MRASTTTATRTEVLHYPRLDTILMVEDSLRKSKNYPTKTQLWRSLKKKVMYQTFCLILGYLERSNKIILDKGRVVWVFADNAKLKKLLSKSVRVA